MKTFTVQTDGDLKTFTDCTYPQGSFYLAALLKEGDVRVNGVKVKSNVPLKAGDTVTYYTTPKQESKPSHAVAYEDNNLLVADKYSGVSSEALFSELRPVAPYPVHRLDRNTCGLIVIAKTEGVQAALLEAFRERSVRKIYLCIAKNAFKSRAQKLTAYLYKDGGGTVRVYDSPAEGRERIVTEYSVEKEMDDVALVKVTLHTGKTHQIRAHLAHIGCPVLGDTRYGDGALNKKYSAARQLLVAKYIKFSLKGELEYLNDISFTSSFFPEIKA